MRCKRSFKISTNGMHENKRYCVWERSERRKHNQQKSFVNKEKKFFMCAPNNF